MLLCTCRHLPLPYRLPQAPAAQAQQLQHRRLVFLPLAKQRAIQRWVLAVDSDVEPRLPIRLFRCGCCEGMSLWCTRVGSTAEPAAEVLSFAAHSAIGDELAAHHGPQRSIEHRRDDAALWHRTRVLGVSMTRLASAVSQTRPAHGVCSAALLQLECPARVLQLQSFNRSVVPDGARTVVLSRHHTQHHAQRRAAPDDPTQPRLLCSCCHSTAGPRARGHMRLSAWLARSSRRR